MKIVSIAVYAFGLATLMARIPNDSTNANGWLNKEVSKLFGFIPFFNIIQVNKRTFLLKRRKLIHFIGIKSYDFISSFYFMLG